MIEYNRDLPLPIWFEQSSAADALYGKKYTIRDFVKSVNEQPHVDKMSARLWLDVYGITGAAKDAYKFLPSAFWHRIPLSMRYVFTPCNTVRKGRFKPIKDERLLEIMKSDSISRFCLYNTLGHFKMTPKLLRQLLMSDEGFNLTMYALETYERIVAKIPKWRLFTYLSAYCKNEQKCIEVTKFLMKRGLNLAGEVDSLGLTPLNYTLFARRGEFLCADRPREHEEFLMKCGCNPYHKDAFGLSYDQISKAFYD